MIRVLLVDGSPADKDLSQALAGLEGIALVGTAPNSRSALEMIARLRPQVVCAVMDTAESDGLDLARAIMADTPTPILLLGDGPASAAKADEALKAGALEVMPYPALDALAPLATRLRVLAGVKVFTRRPARSHVSTTPSPGATGAVKVVAIGASTGGPQALARLLRGLDAGFPWPIVCVQHMSDGFLLGLVGWLASQTSLPVEVARTGVHPLPGRAYFAPEQRHLRLRLDGSLGLEPGDPVDGHLPSATVLFESVARVHGGQAIGILLTGMGVDGAQGLLSMARAGALTLAQDEESSVVFGMPREAIKLGAVKMTLPIDEIGQKLRAFAEGGRIA